jgi:hypothetical protein
MGTFERYWVESRYPKAAPLAEGIENSSNVLEFVNKFALNFNFYFWGLTLVPRSKR